jgi:Ca2+/Na+ antiporter
VLPPPRASELFTGFSRALTPLPTYAAGDIFGSCMFNPLILIAADGLEKRFRVAWDPGAIAVVYAGAVWLVYRMHG